ncbi:hypothetical protein [Desulfofustis glycolicus]|nr:hypothetical protein [Desulfofustis glycolicus]
MRQQKISFYGIVTGNDMRGSHFFAGMLGGKEEMTRIAAPLRQSTAMEETMSMKDAYQQKIEAQLDEWKAEIEKMKARAKDADADGQLEYYKQIDELRMKQEAAREKLSELKRAGEDAWEDLKSGMELAWDSLGDAMKSARSRFK